MKINSKGKFMAFFLILFGLFLVQDMSAQQVVRTVEAVDVQGNKEYTDEQILKYIKTGPGQRFDEEIMDEDLQKLRSLDIFDGRYVKFSKEQLTNGNVRLILIVRELPMIKEVEVKGLKYASKMKILNIMNAWNLTAETPYNYKNARSAYKPIKEYLAKQGFPDAKVTIFEEQLSSKTVKVGFLIDEKSGDDDENIN